MARQQDIRSILQRVRDRPEFDRGIRLRGGQHLSDLTDEQLIRALFGISTAPLLNLDQAKECLRVPDTKNQFRNPWNASLSCGSRNIPSGQRTGISLPIDARMQSLSYRSAESALEALAPANKERVGDNWDAYLVDATVDGQRLGARNAQIADLVQYLRTGRASPELEGIFAAAARTALEKEIRNPFGD